MNDLIQNVVIIDSSRTLSQSDVHCLLSNCGEITGIYPYSPQASTLRDFPGLSNLFVEFTESEAAKSACRFHHLRKEIQIDLLADNLGLYDAFLSVRRNQVQTLERIHRVRPMKKVEKSYHRVIVVRCASTIDESTIHTAYSSCGKIESILEDKPIGKKQRRFFVRFEHAEGVSSSLRESFPGFTATRLSSQLDLVPRYRKLTRGANTSERLRTMAP